MVWHHRRGAIKGYWRQQLNYGRAEAMLERKWPEKYNAIGHLTWNGRLYGKGFWNFFHWSQRRIYHGSWGTALFQSVYDVAPGRITSILMMPEWYLLILVLALTALASLAYPPLHFSFGLLALSIAPPAAHAWLCGYRSFFNYALRKRWSRTRLVGGTAFFHFIQPIARLIGRLRQGLTPWRKRGASRVVLPLSQQIATWSETKWRSAPERLEQLRNTMRDSGAVVVHGGEYDNWDLQVHGGLFGRARATLVIEEHGDNKQLARLRIWPVGQPTGILLSVGFACLAMLAALRLDWLAWITLNIPAVALLYRALYECGTAISVMLDAVRQTIGEGEMIIKED